MRCSIKKLKDLVIYKDPNYYSSFPSVTRTKREPLVGFPLILSSPPFGGSATRLATPVLANAQTMTV